MCDILCLMYDTIFRFILGMHWLKCFTFVDTKNNIAYYICISVYVVLICFHTKKQPHFYLLYIHFKIFTCYRVSRRLNR